MIQKYLVPIALCLCFIASPMVVLILINKNLEFRQHSAQVLSERAAKKAVSDARIAVYTKGVKSK